MMESLVKRAKNIEILVVSEIPAWFFEQNSLPLHFFKTKTDVGFIQKDAFYEDVPETLEYLRAFYFNTHSRFHSWDEHILPFKPDFIVADICPAALDYAYSRGIPSILVENFTWNWLYEFYQEFERDFEPINHYLQQCWEKADVHLRLEPICGDSTSKAIILPPVSRQTHWQNSSLCLSVGKQQVMDTLELNPSKKTMLLTMGGVPMKFDFYDELKRFKHIQFIIPGDHQHQKFEDNLRILTHHSTFYHPDLVSISDAVITKVGYSTIAEVYNAGKRLGFVPREHFRETAPLVQFIEERMSGMQIHHQELSSGDWLNRLDELLSLPLKTKPEINGADVFADLVINKFG